MQTVVRMLQRIGDSLETVASHPKVAVLGTLLIVGLIWLTTSGGSAGPDDLGVIGDIPNRVVSGPDLDIPCVEDEGGAQTCATPLPALTAADRSTSSPLVVDNLVIKLEHLGPHRVFIGQAVLARGVIEVMSLELRNAQSGTYRAPVFVLELEDASTKKVLPRNIYEKGFSDGPQRVDVYLTFDLQSFKEGATLEVSHIEVR